ncbi:hypothetical protein HDF16_004597 [Granulicella aggregans]|uniref:Transglutaminase superfamily protein n=1 Tax=Granulicella aggregans TaxID=474949 RepID=A0A7W8E5A2_9BACT|nr:DUF3857 and transglutaminase domain-containing protein [Granulicella aggregans]MBB5059868.1 hypothetical protein [Granulicella aggregans]
MTQAILFRFAFQFSILFLLGVVTQRSALAGKDSVPDWVRAAARQSLPTYPATTNAVVLLDETTLTVGPDGHAVRRHRRAVKILRQAGRDEADVFVQFDKESKILALHIWSIGPDGHEYAMKDNEVLERGYDGAGGLYDDARYKMALAPGRDPGGVVAYQSEQRLPGYVSEVDWHFQENIPTVAESFNLELPPNYTYGAVWAHAKPVAPIDLEHQHYRWEMKDVAGIDLAHVPMHPSGRALEGRLVIHYSGPGMPLVTGSTWQSIGEWYQQISKDRLVASPEIAAKASELTAGKTDFYDKSEAVSEFVQKQIRYFVIEMGIGGWQPHPAADIFKNRYGDCKDKATLLSAMLSTVGIHATLVLVDTNRNAIDPDAPSMFGNHMIAAIEIPKGYESPKLKSVVTAKTGRRYLIFDPTWEKTAFGQLEHNLQGGYGVLTEGADSQVIQFPVLSPMLNTIHRSASFQLQDDGSLKGNITEKRFGDVSEMRRDLYTSGNAKEQQEFLDHSLQQDFTSFKVADVKVENVESLNKELTTTYTLEAARFGKTMGPLLMVRPRVFGRQDFDLNHEPRTVPIDLRQTMQVQDDYSIDLPAGYVVDEIPDPVSVDMGFASYTSSSKMDGNTLRYTRTYTVRELTLPAERYGELQKLASVISNDEQSSAVLKKK